MGLLARSAPLALLIASSACYTPELRDCTLACSTASDCADGQVCGDDHFCAGPAMAGHCSSAGTRDASAGATGDGGGGGMPVDAAVPPDAPPDAPTVGLLTIKIADHGSVVVQDVGTCDYTAQPCVFSVPLDQDVVLAAFPSDDRRFDKWTEGPCKDSKLTVCFFPPSLAITASAKLRKD
jgi:hypothetical protein